MPPTLADIQRAVSDAEGIVNAELPPGGTDSGPAREERYRFRAIAFAEVLRHLLADAQPG